jgi:hypothetical protein
MLNCVDSLEKRIPICILEEIAICSCFYGRFGSGFVPKCGKYDDLDMGRDMLEFGYGLNAASARHYQIHQDNVWL